MDRRDDAEKLTDLKYVISDFVWSPDGKRFCSHHDQESSDEATKEKVRTD